MNSSQSFQSSQNNNQHKGAQARVQWRVVDFVTAAVLAVACGVIFFAWNSLGYTAYKALDALTPGLGGLVNGLWFLGGPLGALIIRKPGAALFVELLAAVTSMALGSQWGVEALYSGFVQGLGAELIFALLRYKKFTLPVALLSGAAAGLGAVILEGFLGDFAKSATYLGIYWTLSIISGAVLGGLVAYLLTKGLAQTGALDRFESGKEVRKEV